MVHRDYSCVEGNWMAKAIVLQAKETQQQFCFRLSLSVPHGSCCHINVNHLVWKEMLASSGFPSPFLSSSPCPPFPPHPQALRVQPLNGAGEG